MTMLTTKRRMRRKREEDDENDSVQEAAQYDSTKTTTEDAADEIQALEEKIKRITLPSNEEKQGMMEKIADLEAYIAEMKSSAAAVPLANDLPATKKSVPDDERSQRKERRSSRYCKRR